MKIEINDNRKVFAIQEEFSKNFPYLKLEFFVKVHAKGEASPKTCITHNTKTLAECRTVHNNFGIDIIPEMTVADLEQKFANIYGLSVQIYRKSGRAWLETTVTDCWTLFEQNAQGEDLSKDVA